MILHERYSARVAVTAVCTLSVNPARSVGVTPPFRLLWRDLIYWTEQRAARKPMALPKCSQFRSDERQVPALSCPSPPPDTRCTRSESPEVTSGSLPPGN